MDIERSKTDSHVDPDWTEGFERESTGTGNDDEDQRNRGAGKVVVVVQTVTLIIWYRDLFI